MGRSRTVVLFVVCVLAATSCLYYPSSVRSARVGTPTLQWWCTIDPGEATGDQGDLTLGECESLSLQFDVALARARQFPTRGAAVAAGFVDGGSTSGEGSAMSDPGAPSSFAASRPTTFYYDGTSSSAPLAGLGWTVTGASAPAGFTGDNDVWTSTAADEWSLHAWVVRGYEVHPNVFRDGGHPCLVDGVSLSSTSDPCFVATHTDPLDVLVTNDDGVGAAGIDELVEALRTIPGVAVTVVAPDGNRSGSSDRTTPGGVTGVAATTASGYPAIAVDGFPADAVLHAIRVVGLNPDLVVSGINEGQNMGPVVEFSGTVGAARTGARNGIPSVATSQGFQTDVEPDFPAGAAATVAWLEEWRLGRTDDVVANVNTPTCVPPSTIRGAVDTVTATSFDGRPYGPADCTSAVTQIDDDIDAFNNGFVAIADVGLG